MIIFYYTTIISQKNQSYNFYDWFDIYKKSTRTSSKDHMHCFLSSNGMRTINVCTPISICNTNSTRRGKFLVNNTAKKQFMISVEIANVCDNLNVTIFQKNHSKIDRILVCHSDSTSSNTAWRCNPIALIRKRPNAPATEILLSRICTICNYISYTKTPIFSP